MTFLRYTQQLPCSTFFFHSNHKHFFLQISNLLFVFIVKFSNGPRYNYRTRYTWKREDCIHWQITLHRQQLKKKLNIVFPKGDYLLKCTKQLCHFCVQYFSAKSFLYPNHPKLNQVLNALNLCCGKFVWFFKYAPHSQMSALFACHN